MIKKKHYYTEIIKKEGSMSDSYSIESLREELFNLQDLKYRDFNSKLIPTVDIETMIGVRSPELKKLAKKIYKTDFARAFLKDLPHKYYDEYILHVHIVNLMKNYEESIQYIEEILPYIDNWAVCDSLGPKILKKHPEEVYEKILEWIEDEKTYTIRFGIVTLMSNYLDEYYKKGHLDIVSNIKSNEYYINMAIAWYFSYALIKQYEDAIEIIRLGKMDKFVHNKSIQKAVESLRVSKERKDYLKTLKKK